MDFHSVTVRRSSAVREWRDRHVSVYSCQMGGSIVQLVFDGVADGPVGVALDILGAAERVVRARLVTLGGGRLPTQTRIVSIDGAPVRTASQRTMEVDGALALRGLGHGDVLVLPGLGMATPAAIHSALLRPDVARATGLLARAAAKGVLVAASCSATFVVAEAGLLDGGDATTTWWLGPAFAQGFPASPCVRTGWSWRRVASLRPARRSPTPDLVLAILAHTVSPSLAHAVANVLVLDERVSQARYMVADHMRSAAPVTRALLSASSGKTWRDRSRCPRWLARREPPRERSRASSRPHSARRRSGSRNAYVSPIPCTCSRPRSDRSTTSRSESGMPTPPPFGASFAAKPARPIASDGPASWEREAHESALQVSTSRTSMAEAPQSA